MHYSADAKTSCDRLVHMTTQHTSKLRDAQYSKSCCMQLATEYRQTHHDKLLQHAQHEIKRSVSVDALPRSGRLRYSLQALCQVRVALLQLLLLCLDVSIERL